MVQKVASGLPFFSWFSAPWSFLPRNSDFPALKLGLSCHESQTFIERIGTHLNESERGRTLLNTHDSQTYA